MIFLGYEKPVEQGRELVFDPVTAQMVLNANRDYINAVYRDYQQAMTDMKEFNEKYGDFYSPIGADMKWYEDNIAGNVRKFIDNLYTSGIDPLRSSEGRMLITRKIASMPTEKMSEKRRAAAAAEQYIKSRDKLMEAGMWNEDYERSRLGGQLLEEWDGSKPWTATSASPYMDYEQKYGHLFKDMPLEYDAEESAKHPGYLVKTRSKSRMRDILAAKRPDMINDPQYKYDLERLKESGLTDAEARTVIENEIISRNYKGGYDIETDPYALDNQRTANDIKAARAKAAIDFEYDKKRLTDPTFVAAASAGSGSGKGGKNKFNPNIFREAEIKADSALPNGPWRTNVGEHTGYIPSGQYGELIDPIVPGQYAIGKNKDSGQTVEMFQFNNDDILDHIYTVEKNGEIRKRELVNNSNSDAFTFTPEGQMVATKTTNGYRYFISGTLKGNKGSGKVYSKNNKLIWIEVKERGYVYDGK